MIELYINNSLCDVNRNFSVRLNRRLLKPGELNAKDAQYSFSITIPPTYRNHKIFNYANIEETKDKFNRQYSAELIINGVRVFKGLFRLSEVSREHYKGNLYVPASKSINEIFGDTNLNQNADYRIEFKDFVTSVNKYNNQVEMAIFPYTLYGVLPKLPLTRETDNYSPPDVWDSSVRIGIQDMPPSINILEMLKHIFDGRKRNPDGTYEGDQPRYILQGSAFDDERLTKLYMSYKNEPDYIQPWNYGYHGFMHLTGDWWNYRKVEEDTRYLERSVYETYQDDEGELYACDLFNSTNVVINIVDDPGGNITYSEVEDTDTDSRIWKRTQVRIPATGYYKIELSANTQFATRPINGTDPITGVSFAGAIGPKSGYNFTRSAVKLLRDRGKGDFGIASSRMDGALYRDNLPQNNQYDVDNTPKFMPTYRGPGAGSIVFVDLAQNENHVAGFQCGKRNDDDVIPNPTQDDIFDDNTAKITVAKPAISWDKSRTGDVRNRLAMNNVGYYKYALREEVEEGAEDIPIWTSARRYACDVANAPYSSTRRGYFEGQQADENYCSEGTVNCIVWLEAGELLTLADVSDKGEMDYANRKQRGWVGKRVTFDLKITPFRTDLDWLKIDDSGVQIPNSSMDWNDPVNFDIDNINLMGFLPVDMKTDDFIDNFCKAFNLKLSQVDEKTFSLDIKQSRQAVSNLFINLDNLTSVRDRSNTPLGLPSLYKLGFTVDTEEEGYESTNDDGGGEYTTGVTEEKIVEQKSNFSYNWFKNITKKENNGDIILPLAVISKHEPWITPYPDAMKNRYTNQALRFWYPDGILNGTFEFNNNFLSIIKVSNELPGLSILNYKNENLTILDNYFTLLIDGSSHYTEVEGYLTPVQYEALNGAIMAMFNGDLYYVAELTGYDPLGRNKTKIKLIRKI